MRRLVQSKEDNIRSIFDQELSGSDLGQVAGGVSLNYGHLEVVYRPQDDRGSDAATTLSNLANMRHEMLKTVANNLRA
jgi:hypothetical protein